MLSAGTARVLAGLLEARTGQTLSEQRHWRLDAMLQPLLRELALPDHDALTVRLLAGDDPGLADAIVDALLNNETSFFRNGSTFQLLADAVSAYLKAADATRHRFRIWCAGCSTGQEAYSIAILVSELATRYPAFDVEIVASDVSDRALRRASDGSYSQWEVQRGLAIRRLVRWFTQEGECWRVLPELRRRIRFVRAALLDRDPVGPFDVILCRNVLFYFDAARRALALESLADRLVPDGLLVLGAGETVLGQSERFTTDPRWRGLYRLDSEHDARSRGVSLPYARRAR